VGRIAADMPEDADREPDEPEQHDDEPPRRRKDAMRTPKPSTRLTWATTRAAIIFHKLIRAIGPPNAKVRTPRMMRGIVPPSRSDRERGGNILPRISPSGGDFRGIFGFRSEEEKGVITR